MSPTDIKKLVKTLRALGVTHYKTQELELSIGDAPRATPKDSESEEKPPLIDELSRILRSSDLEMVDRLFPLPKEESDEL